MDKKICFVITQLYNGGAERVVSVLANEFIKKHIQVDIIRFSENSKEYEVNDRVQKILISASNRFALACKTIKKICHSNYDVIIAFDIFPNIICSFFALFSKRKVIISERNAPKQVKINPVLKILRFIFYRYADVIVFQTLDAKRYYRYSKRIQKHSVIIKNPVKENLPVRSSVCKKEIVASGRLTAQKNYSLLITAAVKFHQIHNEYIFRIFGKGELKDYLQKNINENNADDYIKLEGYFFNIHEILKDSDIFVLSSDYEGMPNSLIEAMCMGFPVVSSDCPSGGPKEIIDNGKNGLLFETGNAEDLVDKLIFLVEHPLEKEKIAINALKIKDAFLAETIAQQWIDLL